MVEDADFSGFALPEQPQAQMSGGEHPKPRWTNGGESAGTGAAIEPGSPAMPEVVSEPGKPHGWTMPSEDMPSRIRDFISGEPRGNEAVQPITIDFAAEEPLAGYQESALECIYKAALIAHDLNHTHVNEGHLILALSLDGRAALGMERRKLPVEDIRKAMLREVLGQSWQFGSTPKLTTTSKLSLILSEATRRAAERDDRAASLPDLLDVLESLHAEGRLLPPSDLEQGTALRGIQVTLADEFQKLRTLLDEEMSQQGAQLQAATEAMDQATADLLRVLAKPSPEEIMPRPMPQSFPVRETPAPSKETIISRLREGFSSKVAAVMLL